MRFMPLAIVVALLMSSCGTAPYTAGTSLPQASECEKDGGVLKRVSRAQVEQCAVPYADAGKACSDKSDCIGACTAPYSDGGAQRASGTCQADSVALFGCYSIVEKGVAGPSICLD